jgi:flagellar biosynthesis GTPase FlhF
MNNKSKDKQTETQEQANTKPENGKVDNTNLLAFKRIKGNGEQSTTTTHYLKECTNCKKKYTTDNREARTCCDSCAHDNKVRGAKRHVFEANPADIESDFDINNFSKRNQTQTPHQIRAEAEQKARQEAKAQRDKEQAEKRKQQAEKNKKERKAQERKLQKFLKNLPKSLEDCMKQIFEHNRAKEPQSAFIFVNFQDCIYIVAEDAQDNLFVTFPYTTMEKEFINDIKEFLINNTSDSPLLEILQNYECSFPCGDSVLYINGLLQARLENEEEEPQDIYTYFEADNPAYVYVD